MSFFKCIYHLFNIQDSDNSNNIIDNDNNIKESLLDKYLDVSKNSTMIFENDVEPLIQKQELFFQTETLVKEKTNEIVDKNESKKNFLNQYKKSVCGVKLSKVEDPQQIKTEEVVKTLESKTEELVKIVESNTEEVKEEVVNSLESKFEEIKLKSEEVKELVKNVESKTEEIQLKCEEVKEELVKNIESKTEELELKPEKEHIETLQEESTLEENK